MESSSCCGALEKPGMPRGSGGSQGTETTRMRADDAFRPAPDYGCAVMTSDLQLHNSLTRAREAFAPIDPGHVRLYVCGPTVYDLAHLGNARPVVVFDVLNR